MTPSAPKRLTQGWTLSPLVAWYTGFPLDVYGQPDTSGGFTNPGVSGAGDTQSGNIPHANLTGDPASGFILADAKERIIQLAGRLRF